MSTFRFSSSKIFAWEIARACLQSPHIPRDLRLSGLFMHMEMEMDGPRSSRVTMLIHVHGAPRDIKADLTLFRAIEGLPWTAGNCWISTVDQPTRIWKFYGHIEDDALKIDLVNAPTLGEPEYQYAHPGPGAHQHD